MIPLVHPKKPVLCSSNILLRFFFTLIHQVILLSPRRVLEDQHTIEQEGIVDGDHFLVSHKRRSTAIPFRKGVTSKGPDQLIIKSCTEHLGESLLFPGPSKF